MTRARSHRGSALTPSRLAATIALVALLVGPSFVLATHTASVVSGHTTYWNFDSTDPCLGAVAGAVRFQVLWFDDRVLLSSDQFHGKRFIVATEHGAPSPIVDGRGQPRLLLEDGVRYNFTDPNGIYWNVTEAFYFENASLTQKVAQFTNVGTDHPGVTTSSDKNVSGGAPKYYAWIVRIGNSTYDASIDNVYNFVDVLNTCKFNTWVHGHPANQTGPGAWQPANSSTNQTATSYQVDLWISEHPQLVPLNTTAPTEVGAHHGSQTNDTTYTTG